MSWRRAPGVRPRGGTEARGRKETLVFAVGSERRGSHARGGRGCAVPRNGAHLSEPAAVQLDVLAPAGSNGEGVDCGPGGGTGDRAGPQAPAGMREQAGWAIAGVGHGPGLATVGRRHLGRSG